MLEKRNRNTHFNHRTRNRSCRFQLSMTCCIVFVSSTYRLICIQFQHHDCLSVHALFLSSALWHGTSEMRRRVRGFSVNPSPNTLSGILIPWRCSRSRDEADSLHGFCILGGGRIGIVTFQKEKPVYFFTCCVLIS